MKNKQAAFWVIIFPMWLCLCALSLAQEQIALENLSLVDSSRIEIQYSQGTFNRRTSETSLTATLHNISSEPIPGPIYLAIDELTPDTVSVVNEDGTSVEGIPYFVLAVASLAPDTTLSQEILISTPSRERFNFTARAFIEGGANRIPIADAGKDINALVSVPVTLDGSHSFDPEGNLITFHWSLIQAPEVSIVGLNDDSRPDPRFTPDAAGDYIFELVVNDGELNSLADQVTVTAVLEAAPPNARAGPDQEAPVGELVTLDGNQSYDPNDLPLSYSWSFVELPSGSTRDNTDILFRDTPNPQFPPDVAGAYILNLQVNNGTLTDEDTVEVLAREVNAAPHADAGPDKAVNVGEDPGLDGSGSFDPDFGPSPLSFSWGLSSRPSTSTLTDQDIANADTATPSLVPDAEGSYVARLEVSDGDLSDADSVLVIADDTPPFLLFLNPQDGSIVDTTTPRFDIVFDDEGSGLDLSSYRTFINGVDVTASTEVTPTGATYITTSPLPAGDNQASATIADRAGNVKTADTRFTISVFRAIADCAPTSGPVPLSVRFRSRGEFTGGTIVRYRWDFEGDGRFDTFDSVARDYTRNFNQQGTFVAVLEVTNNLGEVATDTCTIQAGGNAPTASANATPSNGPIPLDVNFSCSGSDSDGTIVLYEWDFEGDGVFDFSSPTSGSVTHTYTQEGEFVALCRVTDNDGLIGEARTTTTVIRPAPPGSPSVLASASPGSGNAPLAVSFNGSATDDGTIVLWEWDFDGDGVFDYSSSSSPATNFTYANAGIFAAALRATDDEGLTGIDTVEIVANVTASLSIPDDTFEPSAGEKATIETSLTAGLPVRILLQDQNGVVVRTLVDETRTAGDYSDEWDGRDDAGNLLPEAPYYAILEYDFGGQVRRVDLTNTTGGFRYNPSRNPLPRTFSPYEDDLLTINFNIPSFRGASEIQAFIGLFRTDTRFVTLLDRVPLGVGTHTIHWDGLDANGNFAVPPPGDSFLFGIFGFTLPDNAIFLESAPVISNVMVDPNFFDPATPNFLTPADPVATVTYNLDKAAEVELTVTNLKTGRILRRIRHPNVGAGTGRTIAWDGHADNGLFADAGDYRLSLQAIDSTGSESITRYALIRVFY